MRSLTGILRGWLWRKITKGLELRDICEVCRTDRLAVRPCPSCGYLVCAGCREPSSSVCTNCRARSAADGRRGR